MPRVIFRGSGLLRPSVRKQWDGQPLPHSGIGLAASGLLNPLVAVFIHSASELTFILNSARLLSAHANEKASVALTEPKGRMRHPQAPA